MSAPMKVGLGFLILMILGGAGFGLLTWNWKQPSKVNVFVKEPKEENRVLKAFDNSGFSESLGRQSQQSSQPSTKSPRPATTTVYGAGLSVDMVRLESGGMKLVRLGGKDNSGQATWGVSWMPVFSVNNLSSELQPIKGLVASFSTNISNYTLVGEPLTSVISVEGKPSKTLAAEEPWSLVLRPGQSATVKANFILSLLFHDQEKDIYQKASITDEKLELIRKNGLKRIPNDVPLDLREKIDGFFGGLFGRSLGLLSSPYNLGVIYEDTAIKWGKRPSSDAILLSRMPLRVPDGNNGFSYVVVD